MRLEITTAALVSDLLVTECGLSKTTAQQIFDSLATGFEQQGISATVLDNIADECTLIFRLRESCNDCI